MLGDVAGSEGARARSSVQGFESAETWGARAPTRVGRDRHAVVEVVVAWGETILSVHALGEARSFWLGDKSLGRGQLGVFLPAEVLGSESQELLHVDALGVVYVHLPTQARITWRADDSVQDESIASSSPREVPLPRQGRVCMNFGEFSVVVRASDARWKRELAFEKAPLAYFGLSFTGMVGLLATFAYFVPPIGLEEEVSISKERLVLLQQYLQASARREEEARPREQERPEAAGASGESARGAAGTLGKPHATKSTGRLAIKKTPLDAEERALLRKSELIEAREGGFIGLLRSGSEDVALQSVWGRDRTLGDSDVSALGNMWSDEIGDVMGSGGLAFVGLDEGGGRRGVGIGISGPGVGTFGLGDKGPGGFGRSTNLPGGAHKPRAPRVTMSPPQTSGRLPPDVIQRTVRQNFGRFRLCYQEGLQRNPALQGRVSVRFVIGRDGAVSSVGMGATEIQDGSVNDCIRQAFYGLSFTPPDSGVVQVTYPLLFSAE